MQSDNQATNNTAEQLFDVVFNQNAIGMALRAIDPHNARWLKVNQKFCDMLGYTREQLLQLTSLDISAPEERHIAVSFNEQMLSGDLRSYSREKRYVRKDGVAIWTNVWLSSVLDSNGKPTQIIVVIEDISERKRTETALRESETLHRQGSRMARLGHWERDDVAGKLLSCSEEYARIYEMSVEQVLAAENSLENSSKLVHPEDREQYVKTIGQLETHGTGYELECRIITRNGTIRYVRELGEPVFDETGRLVRSFGTVQDISERKWAESALEESEALLTQSADLANLGHAVWDYSNDQYITVSEGWARIFGYTKEAFLASITDLDKDSALVHPEDRSRVRNYYFNPTLDKIPPDIEYRITRRDGEIRHIQQRLKYVFDEFGERVQSLVSIQDITARKQAEQALSFQATHDSLTGLINRGEFERRVGRVLESARKENTEHGLCYMDLDQFKVINDTCGHMAGDELLRQLGRLLSASVRVRDTLARLGGDEFGVLMEHCSLEQANRVAENVRSAVENFRFVWEKHVFRVGVSIGLVPVTETSESVANLLSAADSACYVAKDAGRNRVHVYHLGDTELSRRQGEMQWVSRIDQALEENRLRLWSQTIAPVVAGSDRGEHFELLLRLVDEQGKIVTPGVFLPAAERYGLSTRLDRWVVGTSFDWLAGNPKLLERLHLCCINLSGISLADEEFLKFVQQRLKQSRVPAHKICFEVTETAAIANLARAMTFMGALRAQGCRFALDDFGSGLSSFAYLKTLPVDYLKIDGAFVKDILEDDVDLALVRSINDVGKVMGIKTVAEFVESSAILEKLREIGVDYAQGYGISRPAPIELSKRTVDLPVGV